MTGLFIRLYIYSWASLKMTASSAIFNTMLNLSKYAIICWPPSHSFGIFKGTFLLHQTRNYDLRKNNPLFRVSSEPQFPQLRPCAHPFQTAVIWKTSSIWSLNHLKRFSACDQALSWLFSWIPCHISSVFYLLNFSDIWRSRLSRGHNEYWGCTVMDATVG